MTMKIRKEKVLEIANRAGFIMIAGHHDRNADLHYNLDRFAELIVKECVNALWTEDCNVSDLAIIDFNEKKRKIYEHMGVE